MSFCNIHTPSTLLALLLAPKAFVAAQDPTWFVSLISQTHGLLTKGIPLLLSIALLIFIWGIVTFISKSGNEEAVIEGKRKMIWGIVALFVLVSVWGLVALLQQLTGINPENMITPSVG